MSLRQADGQWSHLTLGSGKATIGQAGCTLTCLCEAVRLATGVAVTPAEANAKLLVSARKHFVGSGLIVHAAAKTMGIDAEPGKFVGSLQQLRSHIVTALQQGHYVLLHVDKDANGSGDHYVLAVERDTIDGADTIVCLDPATGEDALLSVRDLAGRVFWGRNPKTYSVVSARVLSALEVNSGNP
jgi:hypothetical protein